MHVWISALSNVAFDAKQHRCPGFICDLQREEEEDEANVAVRGHTEETITAPDVRSRLQNIKPDLDS